MSTDEKKNVMHIILHLVYIAQLSTLVLRPPKHGMTSLIHVTEQAITCVHDCIQISF